jgi:hypothetical protein
VSIGVVVVIVGIVIGAILSFRPKHEPEKPPPPPPSNAGSPGELFPNVKPK